MKKILVTVILFGSLNVIAAFAKDKKEEAKPQVDAATQAEIFKDQRDYANVARQVMPIEIELNRRERDLKAKLAKAQEQCGDPAKNRLNDTTLECDVVAPPVPPVPPHVCATGEFNTQGNPCTPAPEAAKPETPKP